MPDRFRSILQTSLLAGGVCLLLLAFRPLSADAQQTSSLTLSTPATHTRAPGDLAKLSGELVHIHQAYEAHRAQAPASTFRTTNGPGRVVTDYVNVDFVPTGGGANAQALKAELERLGMRDAAVFGHLVGGRLPVSAIDEAAALPLVRAGHSAMAFTHSSRLRERLSVETLAPYLAGSVEGEASQALRADDARASSGATGAGVTIGILSDSYDNLGGAAADVTSGDLPAGVNVLSDLTAGGSDEGRAMIQLAYDVAPGADYAFHTAFVSEADFAQGIIDLYNAGADVIVDDVGYFGSPMFQDGVIAQAVDQVVAGGAVYLSSAGNSADQSWQDAWRGSSEPIDYGNGPTEMHDFDAGAGTDTFLEVTLDPGEGLQIALQWDQPSLKSDTDATPEGAQSDYDVIITDAAVTTLLAGSADDNVANGEPFEFVAYTNQTASTETVNVVIAQYADPTGGAGILKLVDYSGNPGEWEYGHVGSGTSTTYGHNNAAGAIAVGASAYFNTPAFNGALTEAVVESFSSYGGTPILFDTDGMRRLAAADRGKPDVVASDGDNNTFFGGDADGDGRPNFFGTSAAAPNLGGVAALLIEAAGGPGSMTPAQITSVLEATADDIANAQGHNPAATAGYDPQSGHGFVRADLAIADALPVELASFEAVLEGSNVVLTWATASETNNAGFEVQHRGAGAEAWQAAGWIAGAGTTTEAQRYDHTVAALAPGSYLFRLKQVDYDGTTAYSDEVEVTVSLEQPLVVQAVSPNPLSGEGTLRFAVQREQRVTATLYDVLGRQVQVLFDDVAPAHAMQRVTLSTHDLPSGIYLVRVQGEGFAQTQRVTLVR